MRTRKQVQGTKGSVSVYLALTSLVLVPMVGLAIDFTVLYSVKAKLQTAVDAAAIGSGSTLNRGAVMDVTAIKDVAARFFNANFPSSYWGSTPVYYDSYPVQGALGERTITVNAAKQVPMLFLRVLGIRQSKVAAAAQVTVRFVNMILVVDRSGSVFRAQYNGVNTTSIVEADLHEFVDPSDGSVSPYFSDGRDNIGMLTFGTSWRLDFPLSVNFQTGTPDIGTAINNIDWSTNNSTNTADGLFHAYRELQKLNQPGALNVIVLLTDGRPSAFSGTFTLKATSPYSTCSNTTAKVGVLNTPVSQGWIPPTTGTTNGILQSTFYGAGHDDDRLAANSTGCYYASNTANVKQDISNFPTSVTPPDDNPSGYSFYTTQTTANDMSTFTGAGTSTSSPRAIRYAAFNVADNVATLIRSDTNIKPVIFVIGLNNNNGEEALDADWLARVANDKDYLTAGGSHVSHNTGQTFGRYFNVTADGIDAALRQIASEILRFTK